MLIGVPQNSTSSQQKSADIFDVTTADFENSVLKASMERPILVDFWAPWCGPCKQLVPMLEQITSAQKGKIALAKVNVDQNPELAQAFRVQSVPMVVAMYQGQPVSGFAGVRPQADIEGLVTQLIALANQNQPDSLDIPAALDEALHLVEAGHFEHADGIYQAILQQDALNFDAYCGLVKSQISQDQLDVAAQMIDSAPDGLKKNSQFGSLRTALDLAYKAQSAGEFSELEQQVRDNPDNLQLQLDLAEAYVAKGLKAEAVDTLIGIIKKDRNWNEEAAKTQLLTYFEAWGFMDSASVAGRRKLSSVLFS